MMGINDSKTSTKNTIFGLSTLSNESAKNVSNFSQHPSNDLPNNLGLNRGKILAKIYQFRKNGEDILPQEFQEKTQNVAKSIVFSPQLSLLKSMQEKAHYRKLFGFSDSEKFDFSREFFISNLQQRQAALSILKMPDQELLNFFFGSDSRNYVEQSIQNAGVNCAEAATIIISKLRENLGKKASVYAISQPPYSPDLNLTDGKIQNIPHPEFTGEMQKFMQTGIHAIAIAEIKEAGEIKKYMFDPIFGIEKPILIKPGNIAKGNYSQIEIGNFAEDANKNKGFFYNIKYFSQKIVDDKIVPIIPDISKFALFQPISDFEIETLGNKHAIRIFRKNNFTATENFWMQMKKRYEPGSNGDYFYEFYLKSGKFHEENPNLLDEKFTITAEEILNGFFEQNPGISQKINSKIPNFTTTILLDAALRYRLEKMKIIKRPEVQAYLAQNINLPN